MKKEDKKEFFDIDIKNIGNLRLLPQYPIIDHMQTFKGGYNNGRIYDKEHMDLNMKAILKKAKRNRIISDILEEDGNTYSDKNIIIDSLIDKKG